jgi:ADP-ribose pyrophosphatase YjhB (NUDIX family)
VLPGGYATHDERLDQTAVREVWEETGVEAEVIDVIGVRTRYTEQGGAVFVIFRMRPLSGEPLPDGMEVDRVAYLTAAQVAAMGDDEILALSRGAGLAALNGGEGLVEDARLSKRGAAYRAFLLKWE